MSHRVALAVFALALGCAPDPEPSPDPEPRPTPMESSESSAGDSESTAPVASLTHEEALGLLRAAVVPVGSMENQDCVPVGVDTTVAALVEESAANAIEQTTECVAEGTGQLCSTEFTNNSGDEMEEFYLKLEYRVENGAVVEWRGCVFAG